MYKEYIAVRTKNIPPQCYLNLNIHPFKEFVIFISSGDYVDYNERVRKIVEESNNASIPKDVVINIVNDIYHQDEDHIGKYHTYETFRKML